MSGDTKPLGGYYAPLLGRLKFYAFNGNTIDCKEDPDAEATAAAWNRIAVLLPKVGDKNAQKLHAAALDHARLLQQDLIDALATDDVASKLIAARPYANNDAF